MTQARVQRLSLVVAVLGIAGVLVVIVRGPADDEGVRVGARGPVTTSTAILDPPAAEVPAGKPTTPPAGVEAITTVPTTRPPSIPTTLRPTTTRPGPATTSAPAPSGTDVGQVRTASEAGVYVLDLDTGGFTRLDDARPFDVAGNDVLTADGGSIVAGPVTGGARQTRYTIPGVDRIDWFEAADDGTAAIRASSRGDIKTKLHGPGGDVLVGEIPAADQVEWSADGELLVAHNYQGVLAYRRDGRPAWGPTPAPESILKDLRVAHDGSVVSGQFNSHAVKLLEVASGSWREAAVWREVSFGPGRRLMGQTTPPPSWNGRDPLDIIIWDVVDGTTSRYVRSGSEPVWSPDGRHAVLLSPPTSGTFSGNNFSLRIRDGAGVARFTLSAPGRGFGRDGNIHGVGPALTGPRWSADGRHLVVAVP